MNQTTRTKTLPPAECRRILCLRGAALYRAVVAAAKRAGTFTEIHEDACDGSVFSGLDVGSMEATYGPFCANRWFRGIDGTCRVVEYTRPNGDIVTLARRNPCQDWEG